MPKTKLTGSEAGFTLIELMIAAGVMTIGMVLLMQAFVSMGVHSQVADIRTAATHFNNSVLESLRGQDISVILTYNEDNEIFDIDAEGYVTIYGVGEAKCKMWVMARDGDDGELTRYELPIDMTDPDAPTIPDPVEVQVETSCDKGFGTGHEYKFTSSTQIYY